MSEDFQIKIAEPDDYVIISILGRFLFYETWRHMNTEEDMQSYIREAFNREKIKKELEDATNIFLLEYYNDELIGYVKLRTDRTYDEFKDARVIEVERIYVKQTYHGRTAGKALMDFSIGIAKKGQYQWLWLGVNTENTKAINFYKKYGFTIFGTKSFKLGAAVDDDYLMKLKL